FVVNRHEHERDRETEETGKNTAADRIEPERRGDAALFFHAHRSLEWILEHTGETARLLFCEAASYDRVAAINRRPNAGRGLNHPVKHDGETMPHIRLGNFSESLGPGARSEEHTSELQSLRHLVCRLLLEKKK